MVAAVTGPEGSGKSMLLAEEARRLGAAVTRAGTEPEEDAPAFAVDDAHEMAPLDLFALIERAAGQRRPLLLAGRGPLRGWAGPPGQALPDLASRLGSLTHATMDAPDEAMLAKLLGHELRARGLRVPFAAVAEAAGRLRREFRAATGLAERAAALADHGYKRGGPLLRDALAEADHLTL